MHCPNCGSRNKKGQNYCRYCGLHLRDIEKSYLDQMVFGEESARLKNLRAIRKAVDLIQVLATGLTAAGIMTLAVADARLGRNLLALGVIVFFMMQAVRDGVGYLQRRNGRASKRSVEPPGPAEHAGLPAAPTHKLIEDKPFIPAGSVTEDATRILSTDKGTPPEARR